MRLAVNIAFLFQELRVGEKIFHCESCRRILYFQQKEQPAAT